MIFRTSWKGCSSGSLIQERFQANQTKLKKGPKRKVHEFRPFLCEFWCFSLGKQARFALNFCSGMPPGKVHELAFLWFGLPGPLLIDSEEISDDYSDRVRERAKRPMIRLDSSGFCLSTSKLSQTVAWCRSPKGNVSLQIQTPCNSFPLLPPNAALDGATGRRELVRSAARIHHVM